MHVVDANQVVFFLCLDHAFPAFASLLVPLVVESAFAEHARWEANAEAKKTAIIFRRVSFA
jgi:hypothetical protein